MDYIISTAMKEAKDREKGQVSLFSMLGEDDDFAGTHFQLGGSDEEFPDKQIQLFENFSLPRNNSNSRLAFISPLINCAT